MLARISVGIVVLAMTVSFAIGAASTASASPEVRRQAPAARPPSTQPRPPILRRPPNLGAIQHHLARIRDDAGKPNPALQSDDDDEQIDMEEESQSGSTPPTPIQDDGLPPFSPSPYGETVVNQPTPITPASGLPGNIDVSTPSTPYEQAEAAAIAAAAAAWAQVDAVLETLPDDDYYEEGGPSTSGVESNSGVIIGVPPSVTITYYGDPSSWFPPEPAYITSFDLDLEAQDATIRAEELDLYGPDGPPEPVMWRHCDLCVPIPLP